MNAQIAAEPAYRILEPQPTAESPYTIGDYPYGFRLRTQIRYWIETTKNGQRLVSQTLNPKTGAWNKPKASTYSNVTLAGLDKDSRVINVGISTFSLEEAQDYQAKYGQFLNDYQKTELTNMVRLLEVYSKVEWTVTTKKYKNMRTGEITTCVSMFDLADVVEVNDLGDPVDTKAEENIDKDTTRALNLAAIKNAAAATSKDAALGTFKRSV